MLRVSVTFTYLMAQTNTKTTKQTTSKSSSSSKTKKQENPQAIFEGREYVETVGRRKSAVGRVRLYDQGEGNIVVNGVKLNDYFDEGRSIIAKQPLKATSHLKDMDISIVAKGSGKNGQAEAVRHGIARALAKYDRELRPTLKAKGWLTRDDRRKERKKPGLKKARRSPQWAKR